MLHILRGEGALGGAIICTLFLVGSDASALFGVVGLKAMMAIIIALGIGAFQGGEMVGLLGKTTDGTKTQLILTPDCWQIPVSSTKSAILAAAGGNPLAVMAAARTRSPKRRVMIHWLCEEPRLLLNVLWRAIQADALSAGNITMRSICGSAGVEEDRSVSHVDVQEHTFEGTIEIQTYAIYFQTEMAHKPLTQGEVMPMMPRLVLMCRGSMFPSHHHSRSRRF